MLLEVAPVLISCASALNSFGVFSLLILLLLVQSVVEQERFLFFGGLFLLLGQRAVVVVVAEDFLASFPRFLQTLALSCFFFGEVSFYLMDRV